MTEISKWIKDLEDDYKFNPDNNDSGIFLENVLKVAKRIDILLRQAMVETDDEVLHDAIRKEIIGE